MPLKGHHPLLPSAVTGVKSLLDPIGFLPALVDPPVAGIQPLIHLMKNLKIMPCIFHGAWTPSRLSLIGRESI
jgi:hypothetical protein